MPKWTTKSLKKYFDSLFKERNEKVIQRFEGMQEAIKIFKETNNSHLEHLNNTYAAVKAIAEKNISTDEYNGFKDMVNKRLNDLEAIHLKEEGESKIINKNVEKTDKWVYFAIAAITAFISSLLTALFIFTLNK
jgi:hypothetical protein